MSQQHYRQIHTSIPATLSGAEATSVNALRDIDELEGALLPSSFIDSSSAALTSSPRRCGEGNHEEEPVLSLPIAEPVLAAADPAANEEEAPLVGCEARTATALIIPSPATSLNNSARDKALALIGTQRGLQEVETEADKIERGNRQVYSVNYFQKEHVREANHHARERQRREDLGLDQTTTTPASLLPKAADSASLETPSAPQEFYEGTYGKEYEVSQYEVSAYSTSEYDVKPYSSVYEK
jgi:hypothetical protein